MKIKSWQFITVIICITLGILLHFTYEWSRENMLVGLFSAVNESTWEHLKLIFYPMVLVGIIGYFIIGKRTNNYWLTQSTGIITAMLFTIVFFYTYKGVIGTNIDWVNIATFVVAIILGQYVTYTLLISPKLYNGELISIVFLIILFLSFILYTFNPPEIGLFKDPVSGIFGVL